MRWAGAKGYLLKDVSLERLTDGIREVARGGSIIRPAITERVLKGSSTCVATSTRESTRSAQRSGRSRSCA